MKKKLLLAGLMVLALPVSASAWAPEGNSFEVQLEYLSGKAMSYKDRHINTYNIHLYRKWRNLHAMQMYYGLTLQRAIGYTTEDGIYRDSQAVGIGPSLMVRWERRLTGKLYGSIDAAGSFMLYNHAHPGGGRIYNFFWRAGPRLIWRANDTDAVGLGWMWTHTSNGWSSHNPGYNGAGFNLSFQHRF